MGHHQYIQGYFLSDNNGPSGRSADDGYIHPHFQEMIMYNIIDIRRLSKSEAKSVLIKIFAEPFEVYRKHPHASFWSKPPWNALVCKA